MNDDPRMADLRVAGSHHDGRFVWIIAADRANLGAGLGLGDVGDNGEARDTAPMAVCLGLGELACGDFLGPVSRLEKMVVAGRVGQAGVEVLKLSLAIVVKKPVEKFLVIRPRESQNWRWVVCERGDSSSRASGAQTRGNG